MKPNAALPQHQCGEALPFRQWLWIFLEAMPRRRHSLPFLRIISVRQSLTALARRLSRFFITVRFIRILTGLALMVFSVTFLTAQKAEPRFERYPADVYAGKPAPLNLGSHRLARMYRTSIREQLQTEGINFAGHYTIAVMGCGTGCSITAIVDARSGKAYFPRALEGWSVIPGDYQFADNEDVRAFRANSRLLKIIGAPRLSADEQWGPSGVYYYEWTNNQLRRVQFVPAPRTSQP